MKVCSICKSSKPIEDFNRDVDRADGHDHRCKTCTRARNVAWRAANREKHRAYNAQYRKDHPEIDRASRRAYKRRRRALKAQVKERYTAAQEAITLKAFNNRCFNCGSTTDLCIDHHLPLSRGNKLALYNAVVLCGVCNVDKSNKEPQAYYGPEKAADLDVKLICLHTTTALHAMLGLGR